MQYAVKILQDHDLPAGSDWCIVSEPGLMTACIKRSATQSPQILAEAWSAARQTRELLAPPA